MKNYLALGMALLLLTNAFVLAGVAYNRSGEQSASLILTERELSLPHYFINSEKSNENSGLSLTLDWRIADKKGQTRYAYNRDIVVTKTQLASLGFNLPRDENYDNDYMQEMYWALEFDGEIYQQQVESVRTRLAAAEQAFESIASSENMRRRDNLTKYLYEEVTSNSRLFFAELSADYHTLADKYAKNPRYIIVKGKVSPRYESKHKEYRLVLHGLLNKNLMVSSDLMHALNDIIEQDRQQFQKDKLNGEVYLKNLAKAPRYSFTVIWGKRLEPWLDSVKVLDPIINKATPHDSVKT